MGFFWREESQFRQRSSKGTLWHRGGANLSDRPRLIITPQYCAGWVRQLENMILAVPAEVAEKLPERARELIGYFDPSAVHGACRRRPPQATVAVAGQGVNADKFRGAFD
jgi:ectoine hydroxylase-related dioxygenase (phytanoyl-CoA dioxygenase family)